MHAMYAMHDISHTSDEQAQIKRLTVLYKQLQQVPCLLTDAYLTMMVLPMLIKLCGIITPVPVLTGVAACVATAVKLGREEVNSAVMSSSSLPTIVEVLENSSDCEVIHFLMSTLITVTTDANQNIAAIVNSGVVPKIINFMKHDELKICEWSMRLMANLAAGVTQSER